MKHKVCLLFTFLSLSVSGISATNGQDSIRQIQLSDLEVQIRWVNPTAIRAYLDDTKTALGGKAPALYEKLSRLETLLPGVRQAFSDKVSGNTIDEVIGQAQEILALKREIILANPLLDMDKIIVARYRLGNKARKAMGPSMGTSTANYNSLFSNSRKGYDAEIDLLTGLRGQIESSRIYKPEADVPVSDIQLHWDADRLLFSSLDKNRKWQIYEMNIDGSNLHQKITVDEPDLEFCDANYLPDGKVVATTNIGYNGVPCVHGDDVVANLVSFDPETRALRRLTFDQDGNWSPYRDPERTHHVHPLGIYGPDTLFLPYRDAHEPRRDGKQSALRQRLLFPEQYVRHETALQAQQPLHRHHLRPSRDGTFRAARHLRPCQKPERGKGDDTGTAVQRPPDRPDHQGRIGGRRLASVHEAVPAQRKIFFSCLQTGQGCALGNLPGRRFR